MNILAERPADHVLLLRLNRPKARNALSKALLAELAGHIRAAEKDGSVRVIVLTGDQNAFSAGADIKEMPDDAMPMWAEVDRLGAWKSIERTPLPIVAAVNGYALGGGCELMLLSDVVILGENAKLGFPEVTIAAFPGDGGTQRLPRLVGKDRAMGLIMTGSIIDARKAYDWGIGMEVLANEDTVPRALEIARRIATMSPIAVRMIKEEILMSFSKPLDESLSLERKLLLWQTFDHDEGIAAFVEKRAPSFKGR